MLNELFLEQVVQRRALDGGDPELTRQEQRSIQLKAKSSGLWGIDTPAEYGGADLSKVAIAISNIELGRSFLDFILAAALARAFYYG